MPGVKIFFNMARQKRSLLMVHWQNEIKEIGVLEDALYFDKHPGTDKSN